MTSDAHPLIRGYVVSFSFRKTFGEDNRARFDIELVVSKDWQSSDSNTFLRFRDARNVRYGDSRDGMNFGAQLCLKIVDIGSAGWDGIRFEVTNIEQGCPFSLHCRSFDVEDISEVLT